MPEPEDAHSQHGVLNLDLAIRNDRANDGTIRYCYLLADGAQSPTLRVNPGDLVVLHLKNELISLESDDATSRHQGHTDSAKAPDPCNSGRMSLTATNLHFHGLTIPPICHQDEVLRTAVQPGDGAFEYRFRVPANEAPGLYWYYPHSLTLAQQSENGLPSDYYQYFFAGGTGQAAHTPDARITNVNSLPPGPFQLTNGKSLGYHAYAASPVHRFYQMWQQLDCSVAHATVERPSGCDSQLFSWVEVTVGAGANGAQQPSNFSTEYSPTAVTTGEGSTALGFYNVQNGDAPYFKRLADDYAMSDNFHQSVNGGTGANHIMLGHGDAIWFSDGAGHPLQPPHNTEVAAGTANAGVVDEVENPNPASGTNNWYAEDGYGGGSFGSASFGGGSYSDCADLKQPGVAPLVKYLQSLRRPIDPHCEPGHYYLLNNYNPGYFGNGNNAYTDTSANNTVFTIPPSSTRSIGDSLLEKGISWKYYGDQWNNYVPAIS